MMSTDSCPAAEFELTPEDWAAVNAAHFFDSPLYREATRKGRVVGAALFAALALLSLLQGSADTALLFAVGVVAFPLMIGPLQRRAQRASLRKLGDQGIANGTFGRHRVEVRAAGLFHGTDAYESIIRWHAIDRVVEKAGHFFVYIGPNAFIPVPVTGFPSAESMRRFADAFYDRIASARDGRAGLAEQDPTLFGAASVRAQRPDRVYMGGA
jgi:hypothetical protein